LANRWYPTTITQEQVEGGYHITLTTDTGCHLWLYWTDKEPWVHRRSTVERGLLVPWASYWCYVDWHTIEQNEAGDTTTHTFNWLGWETCQTKWFTFHGEVAGVESPSGAPILHKHYVYVHVPVVHEVILDADHETVYHRIASPNWDTAHDAAHTAGYERVITLYLRSYHWAGNYNIDRDGLRFNTTVIPAEAEILEVELYIYPIRIRNYANCYLYFLYTASHPFGSGYVGEFGDYLPYQTPVVPPMLTTALSLNAYNQFTFDALGRSMIHNADPPPGPGQRGTVIPIRLSHDVLDTPPGPNATSGGSLDYRGSTHAYPPKLRVKYQV